MNKEINPGFHNAGALIEKFSESQLLNKNYALQSKVCQYFQFSSIHPSTRHEGPEGKYRYSSTLSLTSVLDGVGGQGHA